MPRAKPITSKADLAPEHYAAADAVIKTFGHIRGPFSARLHSPGLAQKLVPMVGFVRDDTIVEPSLRFVAILAAARECDAPYVWAAQVAQARKHKIREDLIDHIRAQGDPAKLPENERDVMNYALQLTRTHRADKALFARASALLEQWALADISDKLAREISYGQQRQVDLMLAMAGEAGDAAGAPMEGSTKEREASGDGRPR